jgi:Predicted nucleotide-binding protein containing TIR -like domain
MSDDSKPFSVFFSWQSDASGKVHTSGVRAALRAAATEVDDLFGVQTVLDEATRNVGGAVNIPATLADKIRKSDVFVADVTTVHSSENGTRKSPNPNVVFELGLAVAHLGWSRIILLLNDNVSEISDLPFDFDRHRATPFTITSKGDRSGRRALAATLEKALGAIISENAKRPRELEGLDPAQTKHTRDVENLRWIMSQVSMSAIDNHLERLPDSMMMAGPMMYDDFDEVFKSSSFHLYDNKLSDLLKRVRADWGVTVSYGRHYRDASNPRLQIFGGPHGSFPAGAEKDRRSIIAARDRLARSWPRLTGYIRDAYLEVDLDETSRVASERYRRGWEEE